MRTLRLNLLLFAILLILVGPATATVTFNNWFPATLYRTVGTSIVFNWTGIADDINLSNNLTSFLFITPTNNETHFIQNATVTNCKNNTVCSATVSGFGAGFYQWYVLMMDNDGNTSLGAKWFEIVDTTNESLYYWMNDSGFVAMTLDKNSGDLAVTGTLGSSDDQSNNWTIAYNWTSTRQGFWESTYNGWVNNFSALLAGAQGWTNNATAVIAGAFGWTGNASSVISATNGFFTQSSIWNSTTASFNSQSGAWNATTTSFESQSGTWNTTTGLVNNLQWSQTNYTSYPDYCPAGTALTGINGTSVCTDYELFVPAYIYVHSNDNTAPDPSPWTNVTFGTEAADLKYGFTHTHDGSTPQIITPTYSGFYQIAYSGTFIDTGGSPTSIVTTRVTANGTEIAGSSRAIHITDQNKQMLVSAVVLANLTSGDQVIFEWNATKPSVERKNSGVGDHPSSGMLTINRIR